jgi:HlyD family secretion protein
MSIKIADTSGQDISIAGPNKNKRYLLIGLILIAVIALFVAMLPSLTRWSDSEMSVSRERLRLATVSRGDFVRDLSVQGRVVAAVSPRLYSPAQGTITFAIDAGDSVIKGQLLASIDSPELTNQLKQEQSSLQSLQMDLDRQRISAKKQALEDLKAVDLAKVALTAADREKRRADKAYHSHSISQIDFEEAQDELAYAHLIHEHAVKDAALNGESLAFEVQSRQLEADRQALSVDELSRKVDELALRSPVDGIVGNLAVEQKNQVAKNQAILSVVDLSEFELEVDIPESYADDLAIGMGAEVNLNGQNYPASLVTISPEIENNQVTGRVRFNRNSATQPQGLRQNQRLTTRILIEHKEDVLLVQRGQFLESGNGRIAYVVKDNMAVRTAILTGARSLSSVEILEGLKAGDNIIVSGTDQFSGAQNVLLTN